MFCNCQRKGIFCPNHWPAPTPSPWAGSPLCGAGCMRGHQSAACCQHRVRGRAEETSYPTYMLAVLCLWAVAHLLGPRCFTPSRHSPWPPRRALRVAPSWDVPQNSSYKSNLRIRTSWVKCVGVEELFKHWPYLVKQESPGLSWRAARAENKHQGVSHFSLCPLLSTTMMTVIHRQPPGGGLFWASWRSGDS